MDGDGCRPDRCEGTEGDDTVTINGDIIGIEECSKFEVQLGSGDDKLSGIGDTELVVGPAYGVLDGDGTLEGNHGKDTCNARTEGSGVIVNCP